MKKIILLVSILFSIKLEAQTKVSVDTNSVCMPVEIAKQVAADLITGDSAKAILSLTSEELDLTKAKLSYKDSIIVASKIKELNLLDQVRNERLQKEGYITLLDDAKKQYATLSKEYKRYKVKKKLSDILFTGGLIALTGLLIYK